MQSTDYTKVTFGDWEKASQPPLLQLNPNVDKPLLENGSSFSPEEPEEPARLPVNPVFSASSKTLAYKLGEWRKKRRAFLPRRKLSLPSGRGAAGASVAGGVYLQS